MKTMKRTLSVLLAMMMALALAIPAFAAAPTYTITINNDQAGHTYEAYQIFAGDVASEAEQDATADPADDTTGPILSNITWGTGVDDVALLTALKAADNAKYGACETAADVAKVIGTTAAHAAAFAQIAAGHLTDTHKDSTYNAEAKTYTITDLDGGYYLVKDKDGELEGDIVFWHSFAQGPRMEKIQAAADEFMELHPKVNITIETFSWADFYTKWTTGLASGNVPDISSTIATQLVEMIDADAVIPVDDLIDEVGRDKFY